MTEVRTPRQIAEEAIVTDGSPRPYPVEHHQRVEAIMDYEPEGENAEHLLRLCVGDIIYVMEPHDSGWWGGHKEGVDVTGWFPACCVRVLDDVEPSYVQSDTEPNPLSTSDRRMVASPQRMGFDLEYTKIAELMDTTRRLEMDLAAEQKKYSELELNHTGLQQTNTQLQQTTRNLQQSMSELQQLKVELQQSNVELRQTREELLQDLESERARTSKLESDLERAEADKQRMSAEIARLKDEQVRDDTEYQEQINAYQERVATLETRISKFEASREPQPEPSEPDTMSGSIGASYKSRDTIPVPSLPELRTSTRGSGGQGWAACSNGPMRQVERLFKEEPRTSTGTQDPKEPTVESSPSSFATHQTMPGASPPSARRQPSDPTRLPTTPSPGPSGTPPSGPVASVVAQIAPTSLMQCIEAKPQAKPQSTDVTAVSAVPVRAGQPPRPAMRGSAGCRAAVATTSQHSPFQGRGAFNGPAQKPPRQGPDRERSAVRSLVAEFERRSCSRGPALPAPSDRSPRVRNRSLSRGGFRPPQVPDMRQEVRHEAVHAAGGDGYMKEASPHRTPDARSAQPVILGMSPMMQLDSARASVPGPGSATAAAIASASMPALSLPSAAMQGGPSTPRNFPQGQGSPRTFLQPPSRGASPRPTMSVHDLRQMYGN